MTGKTAWRMTRLSRPTSNSPTFFITYFPLLLSSESWTKKGWSAVALILRPLTVKISYNLSGILPNLRNISEGWFSKVSRFTVVTQSPSRISHIFLLSSPLANNTSTSPVRHKKFHWVLCSLRGSIISLLLSTGVLIRRK